LSGALNNLGNALAAQGRFDEAIKNYRQAIQLNSNYAEALDNLGIALTAQEQFDEAVETFRKAIQINSNRPETFFHLGHDTWPIGSHPGSGRPIPGGTEIESQSGRALNNLAWVLAASPMTSFAMGRGGPFGRTRV